MWIECQCSLRSLREAISCARPPRPFPTRGRFFAMAVSGLGLFLTGRHLAKLGCFILRQEFSCKRPFPTRGRISPEAVSYERLFTRVLRVRASSTAGLRLADLVSKRVQSLQH